MAEQTNDPGSHEERVNAILAGYRDAAACCPAPLGRDLLDVLDRQRRCLSEAGDLRPAPP